MLIGKHILKNYEGGYPTPPDEGGIRALRWHGAKATIVEQGIGFHAAYLFA